MSVQPVQSEPLYVHTFSVDGGMNDKDRPHLLAENQSVLVQNLDISKRGARKRREGVESIGARSDTPFGLWRAKDSTLDRDALFAVYAGTVYIAQGAGVLNERASDVSLVNALHAGVEGRYDARAATYIIQAQPHDSDSSLASKIAVLTDNNQYTQAASMAPLAAVWLQNRMWAANNLLNQNEETLWYSSLGDGLSYSANNTLQIEPGVGGRITALVAIRDLNPEIVVFKQRAIAVLQPFWGASSALIPAAADQLDTIKSSVRLISRNVGCVAQLSVQYAPGAPFGDIYFLAEDGVRAISRAQDDTVAGVSVPVSDVIRDTIARINFKYAHKAVSEVFDGRYHLAVPLDGATENTHVLSFDFLSRHWYLNTWDVKAFSVSRMNEEQPQLWYQSNVQTADCSVTGSFTGYQIFQTGTGLLDPGGIPVIYQEDTRAFTFGGIDRKSAWDNLQLTVLNEAAETCAMGLLYNIDQRGWITFASAVIGGVSEDPILGETPLPWGSLSGVIRTFRFSLADVKPSYSIQIRYLGQSDLSIPTILDLAVGGRPLAPEFDRETA